MSSDRLRLAADRLDDETAQRRATFGTNWERVRRDTAAAALLRAHADYWHPSHCGCFPGINVDPLCAAALALADSILGSADD